MKRLLIFTVSLFLAAGATSSLFAQAVKFEFKQKKGNSGSYISTVEEDVYINNIPSHHAEIINRISCKMTNVASDGEAFIYATYMTTENSISKRTGRSLSWGEETTSVFSRKKNGELTISDDIYMPTVRNVPVFPDKKVKVGETWTARGKEVQDVRKAFNMDKALIFPFEANYVYKEDKTIDGKKLNVIDVDYTFSYDATDEQLNAGQTLTKSTGWSKQTLYWDSDKGLLDHYDEEFLIKIADLQGNLYVFTGTAHAELTEFSSLNDDTNVKQLQDTFDKLKLENISVKKGDRGLTISLDNIQFEPDSDKLMDSEKAKLKKIGELLKKYSNDLLITGHCAERGTASARQKLSEERAEAVASYLIGLGVRDEYHIFTQGKGSKEPVASNKTEEGRAKNRRVEITIMD